MATSPINLRNVLVGAVVLGGIVWLRSKRKEPGSDSIDPPKDPKALIGCASRSPSGLSCSEGAGHEGPCYNADTHRSWVGHHPFPDEGET